MLQPKYHAVITIDRAKTGDHRVSIEVDRDDPQMLTALQGLQQYRGIRVSLNNDFRLYASRVWDPEDVGREIETILREAGLTEFLIRVWENEELKETGSLLD